MKPALIAAAALFASTAAAAQTEGAAPAAAAEVKVNQLIVYGEDRCPESTEEQINVCARLNERERFRIPTNLRDNPNDPVNQAWGARAVELQYVGRSGIGSCSPTGPGGMIGCYDQLVREARAERAGADGVNWERLIEEARQERLSKIDQKAAADEEAASGPR
ncbi:MAG TPA: hypothetical protein VEZ70_15335 [Allosphingosinicella sp.]|nr:hypothetical protein [Allosphingosinicella sp.]